MGLRSRLMFQAIVAVSTAVVIGIASSAQQGFMVIGALIAVVLGWLLLRHPYLTVASFWLVYALQTTVASQLPVSQGFYYPIYGVMLVNAGLYVTSARREMTLSARAVWLYGAFYLVVIAGLSWQPVGLSANTVQRLFIFLLGALTALQIRSAAHVRWILWAMATAGVIVTGWTIAQAVSTGFAYRGGVGVDPNYVTMIIDLGLIPLVCYQLHNPGSSRWMKVLFWLVALTALYANTLLASRGTAVALAIAVVAIIMRYFSNRNLRQIILLVIGVIVASMVLVSLPGSNHLRERFSEQGVASFNDRLPLARAGLEHISGESPTRIMFGGGLGSSEIVARQVSYSLGSMHNGFLQILMEYGFVGFVLFVLLVAEVMKSAGLADGYVGASLSGLIWFELVVSLTMTVQDNYLFWLVLGVALPLGKHHSRAVRDSIQSGPARSLSVG